MFCKQCGANVPEGTNFCENCGAKVEQEVYTPVTSFTSTPAVSTTPILVFGILALAFACSFWASLFGIIFGAITKKKVNAYLAAGGVLSGKAKVGSILGKLGLIFGIILTIVCVIYLIVIIIAAIVAAAAGAAGAAGFY